MRISDWSSDVCSSDLPDPAIYALAIRRFGIAPGESVFIDDSAPNVAAAAAVGLIALCFTDEPTLRRDLERLELLPRPCPDQCSRESGSPGVTAGAFPDSGPPFSRGNIIGKPRSEGHTSELQSLMRISYA